MKSCKIRIWETIAGYRYQLRFPDRTLHEGRTISDTVREALLEAIQASAEYEAHITHVEIETL